MRKFEFFNTIDVKQSSGMATVDIAIAGNQVSPYLGWRRQNAANGDRLELRHAASLSPIRARERHLLAPRRIEICGIEPALEGGAARRPFRIQHREPSGVAVAALADHVSGHEMGLGVDTSCS
jgi:hypothetical protein